MKDTFRGDDAHLISSIKALLSLDAAGALVPHGVGGHGRKLLESAAVRLESKQHAVTVKVDASEARKVIDTALEKISTESVHKAVDSSELLGSYVELNMSNYDHQDVDRLNDWACRAYDALHKAPQDCSASVAAIQFALDADEGITYLRLWNQGDFDACRREWPEASDDCYIGADPLFNPTPEGVPQ